MAQAVICEFLDPQFIMNHVGCIHHGSWLDVCSVFSDVYQVYRYTVTRIQKISVIYGNLVVKFTVRKSDILLDRLALSVGGL